MNKEELVELFERAIGEAMRRNQWETNEQMSIRYTSAMETFQIIIDCLNSEV